MKEINISLVIILFINYMDAQCNPLIPYDASTFSNATASNDSFVTNMTDSGWEAIGTPSIITTPWGSCCIYNSIPENEKDILRNGIVHDKATEDKNIIKGLVPFDTSYNRNNNMLGATDGEGIKRYIKLVPGAPYILRFSQINARTSRYGQLPNSARWSVTLDGASVGKSLYMPVAYPGVDFSWNEAIIVFDCSNNGTENDDRLLEIKVEEVPNSAGFIRPKNNSADENGLVTNHESSSLRNYYEEDYCYVMNYMLIDNITLVAEGDCESPEVVTHKTNSSFIPNTNKDYVISAWVKESQSAGAQPLNFSSSIDVSFEGATETYSFTPTGAIIEGWQRIEGVFSIPEGSTDINLALNNAVLPATAYFDDIRIHNADGNMKSFVYDPVTQRLMAELDENNYATIYEYDKEGGLVRVKKETERGIYTIQETRSGNFINN